MTEVQATRVLACLREVPLFAELTDEQLAHVARVGEEVFVPRGEVYAREGEPIEHFYVVTSGEMRITKLVDGREVVINSYGPGVFFGEVPLLAGTPFLASGRALTDSTLFMLPEAKFRRLLSEFPSISTTILSTMAERVKVLQSIHQQQEKLDSLGTLAAGLAHELNNPASAALRATRDLRACLSGLRAASLQMLGRSGAFPAADIESALAQRPAAETIDPLTRSEREGEVASWLEERGVDGVWDLAPVLAENGFEAAGLEAAFGGLARDLLPPAVAYVARTLEATGYVEEVESSVARVSGVVGRMETYSFMDRAPLQTVDVHAGLEDTLAVLSFRTPDGVGVERDYDPDLPEITAYGGELNQVWTNLLVNALDAVGAAGTIRLRTSCERDVVLVEVSDSGPGIPAEDLGRVFEPFYTTKDVGGGTGLGLTVSYRTVVGRHGGDIRVLSGSAGTTFQVRLPLEPAADPVVGGER